LADHHLGGFGMVGDCRNGPMGEMERKGMNEPTEVQKAIANLSKTIKVLKREGFHRIMDDNKWAHALEIGDLEKVTTYCEQLEAELSVCAEALKLIKYNTPPLSDVIHNVRKALSQPHTQSLLKPPLT